MYLFKNKKIFIILIMFIIATSLSGCDDEGDENYISELGKEDIVTRVDSSETWAFYWYLCGSDLESEDGFATMDIEEMLEVDLPENVTVIIETGGANEWFSDISADHNSRFIYNSEGFFLLEENPIANMGEPETLEDFLLFCNENYPADRQGVIFWNHGSGSVGGVAYDELFDFDSLTLPEMREAFENIDSSLDKKYELIGFDTCLMATIDVVDICGNFANYLVASEELAPGTGWDYKALFKAVSYNPSIDGKDLGKEICDSYYKFCKKYNAEDMVTLSVVDLSWSEELVSAYNDIGTDALIGAGNYPYFHNEFGRAARNAENYGGNNNSEGYSNMVDLGDLVINAGKDLLPLSSEAMLSVLDSAVVYQVKGPLRSNATGISCYYNYDGDYNDYNNFMDLQTSPAFTYYYDYMLTGEVSEELVAYMENSYQENSLPNYEDEEVIPVPITIPEKNDLEDFPVAITDDGIAILNLGPDIAEQLASVYVSLSYIDEESEIIILLGFDNDLIIDWENGIFKDNFRGVWGSLDGCLVYMELSNEADEYQIYAVPVLLNKTECTMIVSYIYSTDEYKIIGFRNGIDDNGMADGNIRPLISGDVVEPIHYITDVNNIDISQVTVDTIIIDDNTSFYDVDLGDGLFVLMFEMQDIQNNSYLSEAVLITVEDGEIYLE